MQEAEEERQRIEAEKKREEDEKRRAALEETSRKQREREREIEEKMSRNNQSDDRMGGDNKGKITYIKNQKCRTILISDKRFFEISKAYNASQDPNGRKRVSYV